MDQRHCDGCEHCQSVTTNVLIVAPDAPCIAPVRHTTCSRCGPAAVACYQHANRLSGEQSLRTRAAKPCKACKRVAPGTCSRLCRCGGLPARALARGFMPATPVIPPCVDGRRTSHMPVWFCLSIVHQCKMLQYTTRHSTSINAMAAALVEAHRLNLPLPGKYTHAGCTITVVHVERDKLERYLGTCLRHLREIRMSVNKKVADVMHPPDQLGSRTRGCPACSQGISCWSCTPRLASRGKPCRWRGASNHACSCSPRGALHNLRL